MFRRPILSSLTLLVLATLSGCATSTRTNLNKQGEPGLPPLPLKTAMDVVDDINRNAEPINTLEATAHITATAGTDRGEEKHALEGMFSLQRPRDFVLVMRSSLATEANIGSNDERFWLWTKRSKDKAIYLCDYDANGKAPLALGLQPDWIIEALGLRIIPEQEVAASKLTRGTGEYEGTYILTQRMKGSDGLEYVKSTYLSQASNAVVEHKVDVIKGGKVTPMSRAKIMGISKYNYKDASGSDRVLKLPNRFKLEWYVPDKMEMDVTLTKATPNTTINQARFREPDYQGYTRVQLNDRIGLAGDTTVRETRPAPPPSSLKLGAPQPINTTPKRDVSKLRGQPLPIEPDLGGPVPPGGQVIGPKYPSPPESSSAGVPYTGGTGRSRPPLYIER